jgi:carboxypeptidase PM20D1
MLANFLVILLVAILFLLAFILVRTILFGRSVEQASPVELPEVDAAVIAEHLAAALRHATVSEDERARIDTQKFLDLRRELERLYPRVHSTLKIETVNRFSLLYTWTGKNPKLPPIMLIGHLDVVPVDPATRDEWKYGPFDGRLADGYVWGRGSLDMKGNVISALEAVEYLLKTGFEPERSVLLGFGHDEEIGGAQGAAQIAGRLLTSGIQLEALLDEGGGILQEGLQGVKIPVAAIGLTEKGYLTLELKVEGRGGHSSTPPRHTTIGVLARALAKLETHPMPAHMEMALRMMSYLSSELPFFTRMVLANLWLFGPAVRKRLESNPQTNAMIRTTGAVTLVQGGVKDNLLPAQAQGAVNFRLYPGDRVVDVEKHAREVIADDAVELHIPEAHAWEASPLSPFDSPAARKLLAVLGQVYPEAIAAPYLVTGATDSRYYSGVCANIFRFSPLLYDAEALKSIHSSNERIPIDGLARMVQFYIQIIRTWSAGA